MPGTLTSVRTGPVSAESDESIANESVVAEPRDDDAMPPSGPRDRDDAVHGRHRGPESVDGDLRRVRHGIDADDHDHALADLRSELTVEDLRRRRTEQERARQRSTTTDAVIGALGQHVTLWTSTGSEMTGTVVEVGSDHVCINTTAGAAWVRASAITMVRSATDPTAGTSAGGHPRARLVDVLEDLMAAEATVALTLSGGKRVSGRPVGVGRAVIIRDDRGFMTVDLGAVVVVSRAV